MEHSLRGAIPNDINFLIDIDLKGGDQPYLSSQWREISENPSKYIVVAVVEGVAVAFIVFENIELDPNSYIYIHKLIVKEDYRGLYIGNHLLEYCYDYSFEHHSSDRFLITLPESFSLSSNGDFINSWLKRQGFKATGLVKNFIGAESGVNFERVVKWT